MNANNENIQNKTKNRHNEHMSTSGENIKKQNNWRNESMNRGNVALAPVPFRARLTAKNLHPFIKKFSLF